MFDLGASEMLLVFIVAIIVIGPKDLPLAMRVAGKWVGKARSMMRQVRSGFDDIVREAEMEEMEKQWAEKNRRIMADHADAPPMLPVKELPSAKPDEAEPDEPAKPEDKLA